LYFEHCTMTRERGDAASGIDERSHRTKVCRIEQKGGLPPAATSGS
jgi:hypothetical protein